MRFIDKINFNSHDDLLLKGTHLYLNKIYHDLHFSDDERNVLDVKSYKKFKTIETAWIDHEKSKCLHRYDCDMPVKNIQVVEAALHQHGVYNHSLFDYLMNEATINDLKQFILNESILNLEFFDYLALSIVGVSDHAKSEIAANLWDEAGRGSVDQFHTTLFEKLMKDLGLQYDRRQIIESMSWEGIAGINLFNYLSSYSFNKTKYFGMLAATEMLDPFHYHKLLKGMSRLFKSNKINQSYYIEHELVDVAHANGWIKNVVLPELNQKPYKAQDFWLGFYMRLNSVKQYYDHLYSVFVIQHAA